MGVEPLDCRRRPWKAHQDLQGERMFWIRNGKELWTISCFYHVYLVNPAYPDSDNVLQRAWEEVRANRGECGIDGVKIEEIETTGVVSFLDGIEEDLRAKRYHLKPVRRVFIPKCAIEWFSKRAR